MPIKNRTLAIFLATALTLLACAPAYAQEAPLTGHPLVDQLFAWLGSAIATMTILAAVLPRTWKLTQLLARFAMDLRGILTPDPSDDPDWLKKSTKTLVVLSLFGAVACSAAQLRLWEDVLDTRDELCENYLKMIAQEIGPMTDEVRLTYRTACYNDPSVAVDAAQAVKAGLKPAKLTQ